MLTRHAHTNNFGAGVTATENHHGKPRQVACCCCYSHTIVVGFVIELSPYLIKHYDIKVCGRVEMCLHAFLTLVLDGGEWAASHPGNR